MPVRSGSIRAASMPFGHVYVQHLAPCRADPGVVRAPGALSRSWIEQHADEFDLFHVHRGLADLDADDLDDIVDALNERDKPLVCTVHDVRNPAEHDPRLEVLVRRADTLITLTPGAAAEIARRWDREAVVIPHPHVVEFARMARRSRRQHDRFVVGVHAGSVRPDMAPTPVIAALLPLVGELPGLQLQVDVHHDVADRDGPRHDADLMHLLGEARRAELVRLRVHDPLSDPQLWDYLQSLDVSVLPYRFGTHSGWLEACRDLGTLVLAPTCGYFAEQQPCLTYQHGAESLEAASLQAALAHAYRKRPVWRAGVKERKAQRDEIAAAHRTVYASVLT